MTNSKARLELEHLYGKKCMLTFLQDNLTFHHLTKKEHGGGSTVENGAPLNHDIHDILHYWEFHNCERYLLVVECLRLYKLCCDNNQLELLNQWERDIVSNMLEVLKINGKQYVNNKQKVKKYKGDVRK